MIASVSAKTGTFKIKTSSIFRVVTRQGLAVGYIGFVTACRYRGFVTVCRYHPPKSGLTNEDGTKSLF